MEYAIILSLAPVAVIMVIIYLMDRYEPEPKHLIWKVFYIGALAAFPVMIAEMIAAHFFPTDVSKIAIESKSTLFNNIFWGIAFIEETAKLLVVLFVIYKTKEFDEVNDGIVYCASASLGFAALENILYVMFRGDIFSMTLVGIMRAFLSIPTHAFCGILMGYLVGRSKFEKPFFKILFIISGLFIATLYHTVYNFLLFAGQPWYLAIVMPAVLIICIILQFRALRESRYIDNPQKETDPAWEDSAEQ